MDDEEHGGAFMVPTRNVPWYRRIFCCKKKPQAQSYLLLDGVTNHPAEQQEQPEPSRLAQDWKTLKTLLPYLWPSGEIFLRISVVLSLTFLFSAKVCDLFVPMVYRNIINALTPSNESRTLLDAWGSIRHQCAAKSSSTCTDFR